MAVPLAERAISDRRLVIFLGLLASIGPLSIDMYLPSFPAIAAELEVSVAAVQLTLSSYLVGLALGQIAWGPLADRFGRRGPLVAGLAVYLVGSMACALAPTLPLLALARFVQALGGCAGMVIARAVVRDLYDVRGAARMLSSQMLVAGAAPILAPLIGAQLLAFFGWRSNFLVLVGVAIAVALTVLLGLPESLPAERRQQLRPRALAHGFREVMRNPSFLRMTLAGSGLYAAMFAYIAGSPFVFIELFGVPAEHFGLLFGANALGLVAASQLNRILIRRWGMQRVLTAAICMAFCAYVLLFAGASAGAGLRWVLPALFFGISSVGIAMPNATALAMAPFGNQAGMASALLGTLMTAYGAAASAATSGLADGTALPMAGVMLVCTTISLLLILPLPRLRTAAQAPR